MRIELLSPDGAYLIPYAKQRLIGITAARKNAGFIKLERHFYIEPYLITVVSCDGQDLIRIVGEERLSGFLFHPRSDMFPNGLTSDGSPLLQGPLDFPLIDNDDGTKNFYKDDDKWNLDKKPAQNYGNIDWIGNNTADEGEPSNAPVLTWRGPETRYFPMPFQKQVSGLTVFDEEVSTPYGMVSYFTPFQPFIYRDGDILVTAPALGSTPTKVLGAALHDETVVAILGFNFRDSQGGFTTEAWVYDGEWTRYAAMPSGRHSVCWFFNASGTEAQTVLNGTRQKCGFDFTAKSAVFTSSQACSGTKTQDKKTSTVGHDANVVLPGLWEYVLPSEYPGADGAKIGSVDTTLIKVTRKQRCVVAVDYKGDAEVLAYTDLNETDETTSESDQYSQFAMLEEIPYDAPAGLNITVALDMSVGDGPSVTGGCSPLKFTANGNFTVSPTTGQILSIGCISGQDATGSITVEDAAGGSATSYKFRLNGVSAIWVKNNSASMDVQSQTTGYAIRNTSGQVQGDVYDSVATGNRSNAGTNDPNLTQKKVYYSVNMVPDASLYSPTPGSGVLGCVWGCAMLPWTYGGAATSTPQHFIGMSPTTTVPWGLDCMYEESYDHPCRNYVGAFYTYKVDVYDWKCP